MRATSVEALARPSDRGEPAQELGGIDAILPVVEQGFTVDVDELLHLLEECRRNGFARLMGAIPSRS